MKLLESLPKRYATEEEFKVATEIQKAPTEDLLNDLVLHNMEEGFIYTKGVCRSKIADDELFSLVYKTLYRNAKRFRPGGIRFLAFAKAGLRGALSRYWTSINTVKNATEIISLSEEDVEWSFHHYAPESLSTPSSKNRKGGDSRFIEQPAQEPEFGAINIRERMEFVKAAMTKKLSAQERMVIDLVYSQSFNFQEVGNLLGVTRSAVQSMHSEALKKVRQELGRKRLLQD